MTKVVMVLDAMYTLPGSEWIFWMDDDAWFNPSECGWVRERRARTL